MFVDNIVGVVRRTLFVNVVDWMFEERKFTLHVVDLLFLLQIDFVVAVVNLSVVAVVVVVVVAAAAVVVQTGVCWRKATEQVGKLLGEALRGEALRIKFRKMQRQEFVPQEEI